MGVETTPLFVFERRGEITVLRLHGEIDWTNADRLRECLAQLDGVATSGAIVDLEHVPLALASVFGSIDALADRMREKHRTLIVVSPASCFATQVLRLLRYPHAVAQSIESALAMLNVGRETAKVAT